MAKTVAIKTNEFRLFGFKICSFVEQYKVLSTDEDTEEIRDDIYLHELLTQPPEFNWIYMPIFDIVLF